jgi:hypothetical protein
MHDNVLIITHPRSGTHLMIDAIINNFAMYRTPYLTIDQLSERYNEPTTLDRFKAHLETTPRLIKSHTHVIQDYFGNSSRIVSFVEHMLRSSKII